MSAQDTEPLDIRGDFRWAMVPEWVLYSDITANAVRLYAILARHADKSTSTCHPSRFTLSRHMRASRSTVDRALDELVAIDAVRVKRRKSPAGDWTSNLYLVRFLPPGVSSPVSTPLLTGAPTGVVTGDEQTRVSDERKPRTARDKSEPQPGDEAARQWWERQDPKPAGKRAWFSLRSACRAVAERGWDEPAILGALDRIKAVPSVAQLDRELRSPRSETWAERKAREEREALEAAKARDTAALEATRERLARIERERAEAVPMPEELRKRLRAMRGEKVDE